MIKILVVEDNRDMCILISDIFQKEGYNVSVVYNGEDALKEIKENQYDLVIVDYKLSEMNGLEMLDKALRIRKELKSIMISAYGNESVRERARELGAYFFDKPFDIERLIKVAKKVLERRR